MEDDASKLQRANDLLAALEEERNSLANRLAHARADTAAATRRISELEKQVAELAERYHQRSNDAPSLAEPDAPRANGAAGDMRPVPQ